MRAKMNRAHRAARFGSHVLVTGEEITDTEGEDGTLVSKDELLHHLNAGHAAPLRVVVERAVAPPVAEKAIAVEPAAAPRGRRRRRPRK